MAFIVGMIIGAELAFLGMVIAELRAQIREMKEELENNNNNNK